MTRMTVSPFLPFVCAFFLTIGAATVSPAAAQPAARRGDTPTVDAAPDIGATKADDAGGAATEQPPANAPQLEELQRRVDILAAELEKLRSAEPETVTLSEERRRALGLAPSAAATYRR